MTWLTIAGVLAVALLLTWISYAGKQPVIHRPLTQELVSALLDALMYRGIEETRLTFRQVGGGPEVIFAKYVRGPDGPGIRASLTEDAGEGSQLQSVRDELTRRGIPFTEGPHELRWELGQDVGLAHVLLHVVFERAAGLSLERSCEAVFNEHLLPTEVPRLTGMARSQ